jgi:hypothetical protein
MADKFLEFFNFSYFSVSILRRVCWDLAFVLLEPFGHQYLVAFIIFPVCVNIFLDLFSCEKSDILAQKCVLRQKFDFIFNFAKAHILH